MIVAVDVQYRDDGATGAVLGFRDWTSAVAEFETVLGFGAQADYEPGAFYRRELPILLELVAAAGPVETVVVDGYVWLDGGRPGLGAHLHSALEGPAVVGVAKTAYRDSGAALVLRGGSTRPLYVSAAGVGIEAVCAAVSGMHGAHRIPTLLKQVDRLGPGAGPPAVARTTTTRPSGSSSRWVPSGRASVAARVNPSRSRPVVRSGAPG
jgi:deoxyribonuclease V